MWLKKIIKADLPGILSQINSKLGKVQNVNAAPFIYDRHHFLMSLPAQAGRILDVGCGNDSPGYVKSMIPSWHYIGIDVADYNQQSQNAADEYILAKPEEFSSAITKFDSAIDAIISSHNLEHCDDRKGTLIAIAKSLKKGGRLYLSFPTRNSVNFPKGRNGCLNYFDDATHKDSPPDFGQVISLLTQNDLAIDYATTNYQSPVDWLNGLWNEQSSIRDKATKNGTWAFWGFETIIWATKK